LYEKNVEKTSLFNFLAVSLICCKFKVNFLCTEYNSVLLTLNFQTANFLRFMILQKIRFWCKKSGFVEKPVKNFTIRKINQYYQGKLYTTVRIIVLNCGNIIFAPEPFLRFFNKMFTYLTVI